MEKFIKFGSPTCGPCRKLSQMLHTASIEIEEVNPFEDIELASKYNITTMPTIVNTETGETLVGMQTLDKIKEFMGINLY